MIDFWKLAKDYMRGDYVQRINYVTGSLSPFVGHVTAVHRGLGCLDVQWPYGNERMTPDDLVKCNPAIMLHLPPSLDQSYPTYDIARARMASKVSLPTEARWPHLDPLFYRDLAKMWATSHHKTASDVSAYDELYRKYAASIDDEQMRRAVKQLYRTAQNLFTLRLQGGVDKVARVVGERAKQACTTHSHAFTEHLKKTAAYWYAQNRTYRATNAEIQAGRPNCPKCGTCMRATTYRMTEADGQKLAHKVWACPQDLYLIDPVSIVGPSGEPHKWFGV